MPEAIHRYKETESFAQVFDVHASIVDTYRDDFSKYVRQSALINVTRVFDYVPSAIGEKFKYVNVDPHTPARDIKKAFTYMQKGISIAEEIQDSAVKCRFWGEWIEKRIDSTNDDADFLPSENTDEYPEKSAEDHSITTEIEPAPDAPADKNGSEISPEFVYSPLYQKSKWGWGWILLLMLTVPGFHLLSSYDSPIAVLIIFLGWILVPIFYFWVRTKLIKREKNSQKTWLQSFYSGLLAYCLALLLIGVGSFIGAIQEKSKQLKFFT